MATLMHRTYGDRCGTARALDVVGDRWALLVVRELILGPKRFTDLRAGLPGASPNVLAQRLQELEAHGVVSRRKLGPPAGSRVYELTPWGRQLEPIVLALGSWGLRVRAPEPATLSVDSAVLTLSNYFDGAEHRHGNVTVELGFGEERFSVRLLAGDLEVRRGYAGRPDAVVDTDPWTLIGLFGDVSLTAKAVAAGRVAIEGDVNAAARLFGAVRVPPTPDGVDQSAASPSKAGVSTR
ncbi:MAG TPA: winged helix-turn-helix transcriptional regulator [Candidatus Dormibacteraeota bacterium]|jgi:DNA-binding HxlR family transcriptional regulator|nr:winged helix-turn-helix transcriptional regulator [Candidatus Dormibacteraeota bacterium]